jgi:hypothetical protein
MILCKCKNYFCIFINILCFKLFNNTFTLRKEKNKRQSIEFSFNHSLTWHIWGQVEPILLMIASQ